MSESEKDIPAAATAAADGPAPPLPDGEEARHWWLKLLVQPLLFLACGTVLIIGLAIAQQLGFLTSGGGSPQLATAGANVRYICPMMCTPPQSEPGRCPVCAMELVPATSGGGDADANSVQIDPAARRVANIQTISVESLPMTRTIRAVGELNYDEGTLKTLSAYVDGRIESLYADYTGVQVKQGDRLALVYSPRLYSSQVELLLAKKAREDSRKATLLRVVESNRSLYNSSRQRLIEQGMTEDQIDALEKAGEASSRMHLHAPISGTVIEKLAVEGQYVDEGEPIYRLADLSTVWLMLKLFPEDAATIRYGQKVEATVQSLPWRPFEGRVAFIDPNVDPETRTVGVRVVMPNEDGRLRVGDYAKATIKVQLGGAGESSGNVYDAELAGKWIGPRHPHVIESSPGDCPICGIELVPASEFGFALESAGAAEALVVPRNAVLMAGDNSVLYVETEPGRFEIRRVVLGPVSGDEIAIFDGVKKGERVAVRGNFLIDSQMQLAGNPSLIDPAKADARPLEEPLTPEMIAALAQLPPDEREQAERQRICPVTKMPLGSMGAPPQVDVDGRTVFICCQGCEDRLLADPKTYLANLEPSRSRPAADPKVAAALAKLSPADRELARRQGVCPVADFPLGAMGTPKKVDVNGRMVFICCEGCREELLSAPEEYLAKLVDNEPSPAPSDGGTMDLPPIGVPQAADPPLLGLPPIAMPQVVDEGGAEGRSPTPIAEALQDVTEARR